MKILKYNIFVLVIIFCGINALQAQTACSVPQSEKDALLELYNRTNGSGWVNTLSGNAPWDPNTSVCSWFGVRVENGHVVELLLPSNNLIGNIPNELGILSKLKTIILHANKITGEIPSSFSNFAELEKLHLDFNKMTGTIPVFFGNLSFFRELTLGNNQFSGEIPSVLGQLTNLKILSLADNSLEGLIPISLTNLLNLEQLHLAGNNLSGEIPEALSNLSNLKQLTLSSNELSGVIPTSLGNLSNMESLLLSNNSLRGEIPEVLGNLSKLVYLWLDNNELSGVIPTSLGNLSNMERLSLSKNSLRGEIPEVLGNLSKLNLLWLFGNELSGVIPTSFGNLLNLEHLSLSNNRLSGEIPEVLDNLSKLRILRLSNNEFLGIIPESIAGLRNLEQVHLANNKFSGRIPDFSYLNSNSSRSALGLKRNNFVFRDFENEHVAYASNLSFYDYIPQSKVDQEETITTPLNSSVTLSTSLDSPGNVYQWQFSTDGTFYTNLQGDAAKQREYVISSVQQNNAGYYRVRATNTVVTGLTLERRPISLQIGEAPPNNSNKFCYNDAYESTDTYPIVADLYPRGNNILWYATATATVPYNATEEVDEAALHPGGISYWWEDATNPSQGRTEAVVEIYSAIEGDAFQVVSKYAATPPTLNNIEVLSRGNRVYWFASLTSSTVLDNTTVLENGKTYFASPCIEQTENCLCRFPITIEIGIIPPSGLLAQELCGNATLNDVVLNVEEGLQVNWYDSAEEGVLIARNTPVISGRTYYAAQIDANNDESNERLPVYLTIKTIPDPIVTESAQTFYTQNNPKVKHLRATGENIQWYSQPTGGTPYDKEFGLETGTYYAEHVSGECSSTNRIAVTVTIRDEEANPLLGCELFRPELLGEYVIDGWVNERDVDAEVINEVPFNNSPESVLFVGLLNHLKNRLMSTNKDLKSIPKVYVPVFTAEEQQLDLAPLMAFINDLEASEKQLKVYDFTPIFDNYAGLRGRTIGFSFYLNQGKTKKIEYRTPAFTYTVPTITNVGSSSITKTAHYPLLDNASSTASEFLEFTKVEVLPSGQFVIYSNFNQVVAPAYQENNQRTTYSQLESIKPVSVYYRFKEVAYQAVPSYGSAYIEIHFLDQEEEPINTPIEIKPQGAIIDKWQKATGSFRIPSNAGRLIIELKNTDPEKIAYFDDLRIQPLESNMKSFVYDPDNQRLTAELDENNYATFYEYDKEGGLIRVKKETVKGVYTIQETRSGNVKTN